MEITTEQIKALRDETGVSVMQCKKALEEAGGDVEKARVILRKKSGEIAAKKGDRTLGSGAVAAYVHATGTVGAMVVLSSETDFVSKNEEFRKLAYDIAMHVAAANPKFLTFEEIGSEERAKAREVFAEEAKDKPAEMQEKIIEGKLASYFREQALLEQPFIKDPERTIRDLLSQAVQKFGERIEITRFSRFSL
ncbi:MAG TPA: elongation factor Ts [Candidatus Paceibacterota bacterium]|nr:elongation factor Ts [Candidatus Paceibacterota bacterium]